MPSDELPQPQPPVQRPSFLVYIYHGKNFVAHYCSELDWNAETHHLETDVYEFEDVSKWHIVSETVPVSSEIVGNNLKQLANEPERNNWYKEEKSIPQAG